MLAGLLCFAYEAVDGLRSEMWLNLTLNAVQNRRKQGIWASILSPCNRGKPAVIGDKSIALKAGGRLLWGEIRFHLNSAILISYSYSKISFTFSRVCSIGLACDQLAGKVFQSHVIPDGETSKG